jgi:hypothetical protein
VFNHAAYPIVARTLAARRDIRPPSPRSRSDLSAFRNGPTNFRPSGILLPPRGDQGKQRFT